MPEGDIYKVTLDATYHGQQINNVWHFRGTQPISNINDLLAAVLDCIRTALLPGLASEFRLNSLRGRTIHPVVTDDVILAAAAGDVGAIAGDGLPSFNAAVVSIKTGIAGRSKRGRFYLAGIPENGQSLSGMSDAQLAAIVAFAVCMAGKFISATSTHPYWLGVLSRKLSAPPSNPNAGFQNGTVLTVHRAIKSQNRRKVGRGS